MSGQRPLRIGLSSCIFHRDPERAVFKGKVLLYLEESLAHWVMAEGVLAYMLPRVATRGTSLRQLVEGVDGLIMQGGADVSPLSYGEKPLQPEWSGDKERDDYEIELVKLGLELNRPILGICRGMQLVNVALGGSLLQDINHQVPGTLVHRDWHIYDQNFHEVSINQSSALAKIYDGIGEAKVNSVHHQALKDIAPGLVVEAVSKEDGIIEAVRYQTSSPKDPYLAAVQWHPEFQDAKDKTLLDPRPLLRDFLGAVRARV